MIKLHCRCLQDPGDCFSVARNIRLGSISCKKGTEAELPPNRVYKHSGKKKTKPKKPSHLLLFNFRCDNCITPTGLNKALLSFRETYRDIYIQTAISGIFFKITWGGELE